MSEDWQVDPKEKEYDKIVKFFVYSAASVFIFAVLCFVGMLSLYFFL